MERLSDFLPGCSITYTKGSENLVPDALSRRKDLLAAVLSSQGSAPDANLSAAIAEEDSVSGCLPDASAGHQMNVTGMANNVEGCSAFSAACSGLIAALNAHPIVSSTVLSDFW